LDSPTPPTGDPTPAGGAPPAGFVRAAAVFYAVLFAVAWTWSALAGDPLFFASAAAAERGLEPLRDAGLGVVAGLVVILLSDQLTRHTGAGERLARALAAALGALPLSRCIGLALMSGIAEEALFRGVLQPRVGLVVASLLFGLAHFVPRRELLPWSAFAVMAGLLFGRLFDATGNLLAPTLAHVLINAVNLRLLSQRYASPAREAALRERGR